jgi:hypothetical protein
MNSCILMPAAKEDLVDIRDYYLEEAGYRVARRMVVEFIAASDPLPALRVLATSGRTWQKNGQFCFGPCAIT